MAEWTRALHGVLERPGRAVSLKLGVRQRDFRGDNLELRREQVQARHVSEIVLRLDPPFLLASRREHRLCGRDLLPGSGERRDRLVDLVQGRGLDDDQMCRQPLAALAPRRWLPDCGSEWGG